MAFNYDKGQGLLQGLYAGLESYGNAMNKREERETQKGLLRQKQNEEDAQLRATKGLIAKRAGENISYEQDPAFEQQQLEKKQRESLLSPERLAQEIQIAKAKAEATTSPTEQRLKTAQATKAERDASAIGTPEQVKAATFGKRIDQGLSVLDKLEKEGYDRTTLTETAKAASGGLLGAGAKGKLAQQQQAEDNILAAILRKESGAAIGKEERSQGETQYFPRRGDTPEAKAQKRQNLEQALLSLKAESASAWDAIPNAPLRSAVPTGPMSPQEWLKQKRGQR